MGDQIPRPRCAPVISALGRAQRRSRDHVEEAQSMDSSSPLSAPASVHGGRHIRRRIDFEHPASAAEFAHQVLEYLVYLPNSTSVEMRIAGEKCVDLNVQTFVRLVRDEVSRCAASTKVKQKQRQIIWGNHVHLEDFHGTQIGDRELAVKDHESKAPRVLLLYDGHLDSVHAHSDFWNVTPEPQMLGVLPQDYTLFSALADEVDNSLQAVFQLEPGKLRLICVNLDHKEGKISIFDTGKGMDGTPQNCISKWGTIGSSMNRHSVAEAIGGKPPYLKPNFGMYGFGGIGAGLHLGGTITVSSKTEACQRVAILHLGRESLTTSVKSGSVWKTGGEFRSPTEQELQWSPHQSFTKVEISDLSWKVKSWKVEEVQRKLKDYYFPYIQNDEGDFGMTNRPVEIRVNGDDLAGIYGGEVAHSSVHSSSGDPYVIILEFTKPRGPNSPEHAGEGVDKANARITCHYFPIIKGREAIDEIIEILRNEDSEFSDDFETFSRRSIRRLGRLLPDAGRVLPDDRSAGRLPFMEPKRIFREKEVNRHCYKRVKAFIDVDAGFIPTTSKMDLVQKHPFTKALLELGLGLQTEDTAKKTLKKPAGPVTVSITRVTKGEDGAIMSQDIRHQDLHADYTTWITHQHESFDIGAVFTDGVIIPAQEHHKQELNITKDVFRVVHNIQCRNIDWKVGKNKSPVRLKLLKGLPGLKNNDTSLFVTVECFISEGLPDEKGDTRIICRPIEVPEERGSRVEGGGQEQDQLPTFILGESRPFPIEILFSDKYEVVEEAAWMKRQEVIQNTFPEFIELLNEQEVLKIAGLKTPSASCVRRLQKNAILRAGTALQHELIAVVRPKSCTMRQASGSTPEGPRLEQKQIFAEPMEMKLEVVQVKTPPRSEYPVHISTLNAIRKYETKIAASTRGPLKGLYSFRLAGTDLESFIRTTGTYILIFSLVSAKYEAVRKLKLRIEIKPSSKIGHWSICSHSGLCTEHHPNRNPEVVKVRLGEVVPGTLYLTRVDEFSNQIGFPRTPMDLKCNMYTVEGESQIKLPIIIVKDQIKLSQDNLSLEISNIKVGGGKLEQLKGQSMRAALKMSVDGNPVADFPITVFPGQVVSARMRESESPSIGLRPGQILEHITFEVLDRYQNPVTCGEKVKVLLEGFEFQDKVGYQRSVDENGCLDLCMRLRVTAGYGERAGVDLRSAEDLQICHTTFDVIDRKLRIQNEVPKNVAAGSELQDIVIEAVDEDGQVDDTMGGNAHMLLLDWNTKIAVPLYQGRCTLPPIQIPRTPGGLWKGCVAHTQNPELQILITVLIIEAAKTSAISELPETVDDEPSQAMIDPSPPLSDKYYYEHRVLQKRATVLPELQQGFKHAQAPQHPAAVDRNQRLEVQLQKMHQKAAKCERELARLKQVKKEYEDAMKRYQGEIDNVLKFGTRSAALEQSSSDPTVVESLSTFERTQMQIAETIAELGNPPGTHAAAMLLQAHRERYSAIKDKKGIVGIVALLGAVENEECNRALVDFLGLENMLAIVCESRSAAESLGIPLLSGANRKTDGLLDSFAESRNLKISSRYRVITLCNESSFYKGLEGMPAVNEADPQKPLIFQPLNKPGTERLVGSLGYAANMVHLNDDQLKIRISGRGLRETLFFVLFGYLEVFDTTNNMVRAQAQRSIRSSAVSLDGGLIRKIRAQYELGPREDPVVWFPAVEQHSGSTSKLKTKNLNAADVMSRRPVQLTMSISAKQNEVKRKRTLERQRYFEGGTEADIQNCADRLDRIRKNIAQLSN